MEKSILLKELRALTGAGMKDCNDALNEAEFDLQKAIDIIKIKGQNIISERASKVAAEGLLVANYVPLKNKKSLAMVELNCQTDFVSRSADFKQFSEMIWGRLANSILNNTTFDVSDPVIVDIQKDIVFKTKEKCIIRRWWVEEVFDDSCKVFAYVHNNNKLGVILSLKAPSIEAANSDLFTEIGNDLAMQIAAMNPVAISKDKLPPELLNKQKAIFEEQIKGKPASAMQKILDGKFAKWYSEVCLLNQESVVTSKMTIEKLITGKYADQLGGILEVINFIRAQVGEGIEITTNSLIKEVAELSGTHQHGDRQCGSYFGNHDCPKSFGSRES